jgi:hypothetical protein
MKNTTLKKFLNGKINLVKEDVSCLCYVTKCDLECIWDEDVDHMWNIRVLDDDTAITWCE